MKICPIRSLKVCCFSIAAIRLFLVIFPARMRISPNRKLDRLSRMSFSSRIFFGQFFKKSFLYSSGASHPHFKQYGQIRVGSVWLQKEVSPASNSQVQNQHLIIYSLFPLSSSIILSSIILSVFSRLIIYRLKGKIKKNEGKNFFKSPDSVSIIEN